MIPLHALVLLIMGRYSSRLYVAYSTWYAIGTLASMQVPFVGFQPVRTSEHMAALGNFHVLFIPWPSAQYSFQVYSDFCKLLPLHSSSVLTSPQNNSSNSCLRAWWPLEYLVSLPLSHSHTRAGLHHGLAVSIRCGTPATLKSRCIPLLITRVYPSHMSTSAGTFPSLLQSPNINPQHGPHSLWIFISSFSYSRLASFCASAPFVTSTYS